MLRPLARVLLPLLALGLFAAGAHAQDLFFDYVGYDYEDPDLNTSQFGEVNSGYVSLGFVPILFSPLVADTVSNEYTYYLSGLTSISRTVVGDFIIVDYSGPGILSVYEDDKGTGTAGDYGTNPPNGTAPPSFVDGTLFVQGSITAFQAVFNTVSGSGSFEAEYEVTGGSQLANVPVNDREGWTFAGITSNEINAPEGYLHQVDGQVFLGLPTAVETATWGLLKRTFGDGDGR